MESEIGLCSRAHIFIVVDCDVIILFLYNFAENHRLRIDLNDEREKSTLIENEIILRRELNLINIIILLWSLLLCLCARSARLNAKLC